MTVEVVIGRFRQIGFEAYGFSRGAPRGARGPLEKNSHSVEAFRTVGCQHTKKCSHLGEVSMK